MKPIDISGISPEQQRIYARLTSKASGSGRNWSSVGKALASIGGMIYDRAAAEAYKGDAINAATKDRDALLKSTGFAPIGSPKLPGVKPGAADPTKTANSTASPEWKPFAGSARPTAPKPQPSTSAPTPAKSVARPAPTASRPWLTDARREELRPLIMGTYQQREEARRLANQWRSQHESENSPSAVMRRRLQQLQLKKAERDLSRDPNALNPLQQAHLEALGRKNPNYRLKIGQKLGLKGDALTKYALTAELPKGFGSTGGGTSALDQARIRNLDAKTQKELQSNTGKPLNPTSQKMVVEADDMVAKSRAAIGDLRKALALSPDAYDGPGSRTQAGIISGITPWKTNWSDATIEFDNLVQGQALSQLRAIFGGNPTEGERSILMEIQGSSSQPRAVRERVLKRAIAAAERRMREYSTRGQDIRNGRYFAPGYAPSVQPPQQNTPQAAPGVGATATNPNTGEKIQWNGRAWVPIQ